MEMYCGIRKIDGCNVVDWSQLAQQTVIDDVYEYAGSVKVKHFLTSRVTVSCSGIPRRV